MNKKIELCPLCTTDSDVFFKNKKSIYYQCPNCSGIFLSRSLLPDKKAEIFRYKEHNNDVEDIGYHQFVSPIVNSVLSDFSPAHLGLDFGAGTGPVISKLLKDKDYQISQYDPFFHDFPELLKKKYDYIVCCEVIEHFHNPAKEFELLKSLLNKNGKLYCMTNIFNSDIDFKSWYYKEDYTHVFFYQDATFNIMKKKFGFFDVKVCKNLITFTC